MVREEPEGRLRISGMGGKDEGGGLQLAVACRLVEEGQVPKDGVVSVPKLANP